VNRPKDHERALWQAAMRDVKPLKRARASPSAAHSHRPAKGEAPAPRPVPAPPPKPTITVNPSPLQISHGRAAGIDRRSAEKLRRGRLGIEDRLDLHGLTQDAASQRLAAFLERAELEGKRCILVITGKGLASGGILRDQVPRWLNQPPNRSRVLAFDYARPQHGGTGALYVLLKRRREA
jgi:DNA-nicking Smr family endonuclease